MNTDYNTGILIMFAILINSTVSFFSSTAYKIKIELNSDKYLCCLITCHTYFIVFENCCNILLLAISKYNNLYVDIFGWCASTKKMKVPPG